MLTKIFNPIDRSRLIVIAELDNVNYLLIDTATKEYRYVMSRVYRPAVEWDCTDKVICKYPAVTYLTDSLDYQWGLLMAIGYRPYEHRYKSDLLRTALKMWHERNEVKA